MAAGSKNNPENRGKHNSHRKFKMVLRYVEGPNGKLRPKMEKVLV